MYLIEEYLLQFSKRWVSSSNLLPLQREGFCRTYLFQHVVCGNLFWGVTRVILLRAFFVLNLGKQKGCNSFWWSDKSLVYVWVLKSLVPIRNIVLFREICHSIIVIKIMLIEIFKHLVGWGVSVYIFQTLPFLPLIKFFGDPQFSSVPPPPTPQQVFVNSF